MTDYAIARRIVDLHSRVEESVDRLYSLDEIRRYLLFARQFKPKVRTLVSGLSVRAFKHLFLIINNSYYLSTSVDLQRIRGVHRRAIQASSSAWRLRGRDQVSLENNREAAGEYDPPFRVHGAHALLWWGECRKRKWLHAAVLAEWRQYKPAVQSQSNKIICNELPVSTPSIKLHCLWPYSSFSPPGAAQTCEGSFPSSEQVNHQSGDTWHQPGAGGWTGGGRGAGWRYCQQLILTVHVCLF